MNNNEISLSFVEKEPVNPAKKSMIWLHGLGADGHDFVPFISELNSNIISDMRFIFPHAPMRPITINNSYTMRGWYDIYGLSFSAKIDTTGILASIAQIEKLIEQEINRGISSENIYLGGFSQGAAIALLTGLTRNNKPLGGLLALSGYLPLIDEIDKKIKKENHSIPIFQAHGTLDPVVPYELGLASCRWLTQAGYSVDWHSYPILHSVCKEEIDDINKWLVE